MTTAVSGTPRRPAAATRTAPLPARLALAAEFGAGSLAGAWWPRSRHPVAELTALVAGLAARGVVVTHLSLSVTAWGSAPGRLRLDGRDVRLTWFAYRGSPTVTVGHPGGEITLLVIAPDATEKSAAAAMELAAGRGDLVDPDGVLHAGRATSDAAQA
jgi:hypothetical protein